MTKQKGLAAEIQADAQEMVRRAERGIGVAIRNGQQAGQIRTKADGGYPSHRGVLHAEGVEYAKPGQPTERVTTT